MLVPSMSCLATGFKTRFLRGFTSVACSSFFFAALADDSSIEIFVAPLELFPAESLYMKPPAPQQAYRRPGIKDGFVTLADPRCAQPQQSVCSYPYDVVWRRDGRSDEKLRTQEWSYETQGLVSDREPSAQAGPYRWVHVMKSDNTAGPWLLIRIDHIHRYDSLVKEVVNLEIVCKKADLRTCYRSSLEWRTRAEALAQYRVCQSNGYDVNGTIEARDGRRYYDLRIDDLPPEARNGLPSVIYVPVRDDQGRRLGSFSPRGC